MAAQLEAPKPNLVGYSFQARREVAKYEKNIKEAEVKADLQRRREGLAELPDDNQHLEENALINNQIKSYYRWSKSEAVAEIPGESDEGFVVDQPLSVCGSRFVLRDGSLVKQVLVQWAGRSPEDATWEYFSDFRAAYPAYDLEYKVISEEGRNDMPGSLDAGRAKRVSVVPKWQKDFVMG
ncbi:ty3-gypsy retrotransposon protein [Tanacetum coccineum]